MEVLLFSSNMLVLYMVTQSPRLMPAWWLTQLTTCTKLALSPARRWE